MALPADSSMWPSGFPLFDFSLRFEETILEILPSSAFLLAAAVTCVYYRRQPVYIRNSALLWWKLILLSPKSHVHWRAGRGRGGVRLVLVVLEELSKRSLILDPQIRKSSGSGGTGGYWSRSFFLFLAPIYRIGTKRAIETEDLPAIGYEFHSRLLLDLFYRRWDRKNKAKTNSLVYACCQAYKGAIFAILVPRLMTIGFKFGQPFAMQRVILSIQNEDMDSGETRGALVAAVFLTFCGSAVCSAVTDQMKYRLLIRIRGSVIAAMLDKVMRLEVSEAKKNAAITLITADIDSITDGLIPCFNIPFAFVEAGLGMYVLSKFVRQASFVIVFPLFFMTGMGIVMGRIVGPRTKDWSQKIQERVSKTSSVLDQLPAIKMLGLGPKITEYLQHLRAIEIESSKKYRNAQVCVMAMSVLADQFTPVLVVGTALFWGVFGPGLSPEIVYPALTIVEKVQTPLAALMRSYSMAMSMLSCFERIQEFLARDEHKDPRVLSDNLQQQSEKSIFQTKTVADSKEVIHCDSASIVRFSSASLAPRGSDKVVLKDVNLSITAGSTTVLFGATSSGKTTFMHSMLGEAEVTKGTLYVGDIAIALVGQAVWLPNMSIRDCIVGENEFDEERYKTAIAECQLAGDLEQLPEGDEYLVGTGGVRLSGGQCQRVGLARAAYAGIKLVILDDPFSALDRQTASAILRSLCGKDGLFKKSNSTVVLASYLPECMDIADSLIYLDGSGGLTHHQGQVDEAWRKQVLTLLRQERATTSNDIFQDDENARLDSSEGKKPRLAAEKPHEELVCRTDFGLYAFWVGHTGLTIFFVWIVLAAAMGVSDQIGRIFVKYWIEDGPNNNLYFIGYTLIPLAAASFTSSSSYVLSNRVVPRSALSLHKALAETVVRSTLGFLSVTDSGSILNRFGLDMDLLTRRVPPSLHNTMSYGLGALVLMGAALAGATYMSAFIPVLLAALFYVQHYYLRTSRQLRQLELQAQAPLVTALREASDGLVYIRGYRWEAQTLERNLKLLDKSQQPVYLLYCAQRSLSLATESLAALMGVLLTILTLYVRHGATANSAGLSFLSVSVLGQAISNLIIQWTNLETAIGSLTRTREFLRRTPTEHNTSSKDLPKDWPSKGQVELKDVTARYRAKDEECQNAVLRNVSVLIQPGKKFGLKGRTGSGKSSVLNTLLGFLDYEGSIIIDGVDVATAPRDQIRERIITISQEQVELDGTIRDNLLPFDKTWGVDETPLNDEEKQDAVRKDDIVRETLERLEIWKSAEAKGGLDAVLKDVGYSHGEKQLLCIARAVVRRRVTGSNLVLVDEATSSVDRQRDRIVREMMREYFRDCTIIVIAHREESIADADATVELFNGEMGEIEMRQVAA